MRKKLIRQAKSVYSANPKIQRLVKKITASCFYEQLTRAKIKKQFEKDVKGPFNLVVETSNFCNARCLMCPHPLMKRPKKIMDNKTFEKLIARVKEENLPLNKVFFSGMGEPLTDPQLFTRIREFKKLGMKAESRTPRDAWVKLYTNASLLSPTISRQLVELGLDEINISFNGVTPQQYQKVMGLNYKQTLNNINHLLKIKKLKQSNLPQVLISSIVTSENEKNIQKHLQKWKDKVDSVTVSRAHQWGGGVKIEARYQLIKTEKTYPCRSLWHTFVIDSSGNFVVCCRDYESKFVLGNVKTDSFAEIYKDPILKRFRRFHLKYSQKKLTKMCQNCNFPYQDGFEWYLPRTID